MNEYFELFLVLVATSQNTDRYNSYKQNLWSVLNEIYG